MPPSLVRTHTLPLLCLRNTQQPKLDITSLGEHLLSVSFIHLSHGFYLCTARSEDVFHIAFLLRSLFALSVEGSVCYIRWLFKVCKSSFSQQHTQGRMLRLYSIYCAERMNELYVCSLLEILFLIDTFFLR